MCSEARHCICVIEGDEEEVEARIKWISKSCCVVVGVQLEADSVFSHHALQQLARKIVKTETIKSIEGRVTKANWNAICGVLTQVAKKTNRNISISLYTADFVFSTEAAHQCITHMRDSSHRSMTATWGKIPI